MGDLPGQFTGLAVCGTDYRLEGLRAAVTLYADRRDWDDESTGDKLLHAAGRFAQWLAERPSKIRLTASPFTYEQGHPARSSPTKRTGENMAVTLTDSQQVSYSVQAEDSRGFPVADTLTWSEDSNGAVVAMTVSADGSSAEFAAVAPGAAQVTVTDGSISGSDTINVTSGAVASIVLTPGTPEDQPAPSA